MHQKYSTAMVILLLAHYGLVESHLVDCHLGTSAEEIMQNIEKRELQNQRDLETYNDDRSTEEEKAQAMQNLIKNGGMS